MTSQLLSGQLLVASPTVAGDVFQRSVVLVLHHDEDGAQGVILNRPLEAAVDSVLPGWESVVTSPPTLFQGGPVALDSAVGVVTVPGDDTDTMGVHRLFGRLGLVDLDAPPPVVAAEVAGMRIFAGYAGWGPDQLESEIRRGDWFVVDAEPRDAFTDDPATLWERVLQRQRGDLALMAHYPQDPELN